MAELRALASSLGYEDVTTYIASGNLLFTSSKPGAHLVAELSEAIRDRFGFDVDVVVADRDLVRRALEGHPFADGDPRRVHVAFCSTEVPDAVVAGLREAATRSERVAADGRLLFLDFSEGVHGSRMGRRLDQLIAPGFATARNLATVRTLLQLLDAPDGKA